MTEHTRVNSPSHAAPGVAAIRPLTGPGPRVCIVGAGVGGLSMARALKRKHIAFDCFDKRDRIAFWI